jgi:hypothetical protein
MGHVFNTHVADGKLVMEAWIDKERAKSMGGDAMRTLERIEAADPADPIEVSVGVFMVSEDGKGIKNGKPYQAIWRHITPDHLAILPEGKTGACSVAMGCGVHHYLATAQGYQEVGMGEKTPSLWERLKGLVQGQSVPSDETIRAALSETESDQDQRQALQMELQKEEPNAYITMVYADRIIYGLTDSSMGGAMTYYQLGYAGDEKTGYTFDEDPIEVEQVTSFEPVTAAIAAADGCHCHEGEPDMTKSERIKALLALPNNPVKDAKVLEAAPDDVLKTLEDHAAKLDADQKAAKDATDAAAAAKTTADAAQSALKAAEAVAAAAAVAATKELTEEEFLRTAPPAIRTMVQRHKDADAKAHGELVASLKTAQKVHSEDALKAKSLEQLQEIAALLQMPPVDYSLRAVPRAAEASADGEYKSQPPPDGYKLALEKRAAASASRH